MAQNQIEISLQLLSNPTNKIYTQADNIVLESEQNNLIFTIKSSNRNTQRFFCELNDGVSIRDTFTSPGQIVLKNLTGGTYHFLVKDLASQATSQIRFTIKPLLWQQMWFLPLIYGFVLALVSAIVYLFTIYNFRNQLRLQQIRNEIAADLHDDVGTALSSITFLGEMARSRFEKKPEDIRPILERIMNESREMMQTMRGVVWVINPQNDNVVDFFDKVKAFAEAVLSSRKVTLTFRVIGETEKSMGLEVQRNLFLIFKEAVVNIAKHAKATEAIIHIKLEKAHLWVQIQDNGKGFDSQTSTDGNGLRNLKNRAIQIGGELDVKSEVGIGTTVNMVIPIA